MGSSRGNLISSDISLARELGVHIAQAGAVLLTGACHGLPYEAAKGAREYGGFTIGVSAARNGDEHREKYCSPDDVFDVLVFTGMGDAGRTIINVRTCDFVIFIKGGPGTLAEFAQALCEKKTIGILEGSGGVSNHFRDVLSSMEPKPVARVFFSRNPAQLIEEMQK